MYIFLLSYNWVFVKGEISFLVGLLATFLIECDIFRYLSTLGCFQRCQMAKTWSPQMYTLYDVGNASFNLLHTFPGLQYSTSNGYKNTDDRTFKKVLILTFVTKNDSTCDKKIQCLKVTNSTRFSKIFKLLPTLAFFCCMSKVFIMTLRQITLKRRV